MKKTKKLAALLLALALVVSAFAGCGGGGTSSTSSGKTSSTGSTSSEGEPAGEPGAAELDTSKEVELTMYFISDKPGKYDEIEANFNKLFKEKLNCTLKTQWIAWSDYGNKYPLLFSSGEKFDLAYTATWLNYASLAQKGAFLALDELWPQYAPNNWALQSDAAKTQATVDGNYYCIPTLLATYSAYGPYYRTDILEGTDWDGKMENFEDLEVYLDYVKENVPEMEPYSIYSAGSEVDDVYHLANGKYNIRGASWLWADPYAEKFELKTWYQDDQAMEFLTMMKRWCDKGFYSKSALSDTDSTKPQNGKAAAACHNVDTYQGRVTDVVNNGTDWVWKYNNFVKDVSNLPFTQDACVIPTTSDNPERALALYDYITTDKEANMAFLRGIEGTSYEMIDGQIKGLNTDDYGESGMWSARTSEFNIPAFGAPDDIPVMKAEWDSYIEKTGNKQSQYLAGFTINTSNIETEFAACENVVLQYWGPLELGYVEDLEAGLAEFQSKMEAAGVDKVLTELQKQLDEYCANVPQS